MKPRKKTTPWIVSSGFVALDVVLGIEDPDCARFYSGGTSGNVSASMAFLGWKSSPVARLADDEAGAFVRADLNRWGVDTSLLGTASACPTPIVVQKIFVGKDGTPKHRFLWNCPDCGAYFPSFRPVLGESVPGIAALIEKPTVFFTDRISKSSLKLAEHCKEAGAAIVFEPSGVGDPTQFVRMLGICDILKYSDQRAKSFSDLLHNNRVLLEIQTLGEEPSDAGRDSVTGAKPEILAASKSEQSGTVLYFVCCSASRPATDYTARIVPSHAGAFVPLEANQILWQQ